MVKGLCLIALLATSVFYLPKLWFYLITPLWFKSEQLLFKIAFKYVDTFTTLKLPPVGMYYHENTEEMVVELAKTNENQERFLLYKVTKEDKEHFLTTYENQRNNIRYSVVYNNNKKFYIIHRGEIENSFPEYELLSIGHYNEKEEIEWLAYYSKMQQERIKKIYPLCSYLIVANSTNTRFPYDIEPVSEVYK